ncbi:hypothetical protein [Streptomyces halobius]|uniref:Neocarzinostatin family protein n=1 Tax=Streptomyces halobius TaxID=2879846 RepID=A0ABY4MC17_9ACTN|nr:hypothetical protein [Streptomyces halobius]UQA94633.1 hypothetical protein K9S39_24720 [Streptomyces halobius]
MRPVSRTLVGSALSAMALGVAAPSASADPSASVSPEVVGPGGTITVTVMCDSGHRAVLPSTVIGYGQVLAKGSLSLNRQGGTSTYRGSGRVIAQLSGRAGQAGRQAEWGIEGRCPDGKRWSATARTRAEAKTPHGKMRAGVGGSMERSNTVLIAAGGAALAVAGCGGYLLMRRSPDEEE